MTEQRSSAWIRRFHPKPGAETQLVCFPHAGGAASYYHPLSRAMSAQTEVLAVQYPGRQDRLGEACIEDIPTLADRIAEELMLWCEDRRTVLFGHSMGAAVAFEVALRLESRGVVLAGLVVAGRQAPMIQHDRGTHLATDAELVRRLRTLNAVNAEILADASLLEMVLPTIRSDFRASERYLNTTAPQLRCPITALAGADDPMVEVREVEAWEKQTSGPFRMRVLSGGHFFLDDHAETLRHELSPPRPSGLRGGA
ncbi:alpha/beta fold hydrolase [Streptomyces olindensis]|uniref:Alpha/beta fold hydrolase n=1 Tax=Streptomyces olindensis TaxID=358823 RepID=A0ABV2XQ53_9ACTN|nr:oleoyl-ACP hydrolase [Streptomyces olindensis]